MPSKDSKTNFALLRDKILEKSGKEYWRSVEEFVDAPEFEEFVKEEYPAHAEEWDDSLSRRNFVKVMGASLAFAGFDRLCYSTGGKNRSVCSPAGRNRSGQTAVFRDGDDARRNGNRTSQRNRTKVVRRKSKAIPIIREVSARPMFWRRLRFCSICMTLTARRKSFIAEHREPGRIL